MQQRDCIYWHTGCGEIKLRPHNNGYYPSFCGYCYDYRRNPQRASANAVERVIIEYRYMKPAEKQQQAEPTRKKKGIVL